MARSIAYFTIVLPTFVFFILFGKAFELFLVRYSQVIYVQNDSSPGHLLLREFINPYTLAQSLLVAILLAFLAITLQEKLPRLPLLLFTFFLSLLATALYYLSLLLFSVPDWLPDADHIKAPLLWFCLFIILLPLSLIARKLLKQKRDLNVSV